MSDEIERERERERDWADLPPELLHRISKQLPDLRDFIRFRAVCRSWCSSAPLSDPPPQQLPWLLEATDFCRGLGQELRFYSLSTGEIGVINVEESRRGEHFNGPSCGYLLLCDGYCIIPFNPLTNFHIYLPPTEEHVYSRWGSHWSGNIHPVWTGSDPILSRKIAFMEPRKTLEVFWGVYYPDKMEWIKHEDSFETSCYSHGLFFGESNLPVPIFETPTIVCDATSEELKPPLYQIQPPEGLHGDQSCRLYLVELSGVVMRVCLYLDWGQNVEESRFCLHKLIFQGKDGEPFWVEVSDVADHMLFLDDKNAFSLKPTPRLKGNCIYFFASEGGTPCRYDIMTGTFERIPCPFKVCSWFVPSLV